MNAPAITTRVADLIRNPNSAMPNEWERSVKNKQTEAPTSETAKSPEQVKVTSTTTSKTTDVKINSEGDTLSLSPLAMKILEDSDSNGASEWEKVRSEKIQRIQQLVQDGQYALSPEMVDSVAQKIVAMLR